MGKEYRGFVEMNLVGGVMKRVCENKVEMVFFCFI